MISRLLGAIKKLFGGGDTSDFEDAQTDPGVTKPDPAPVNTTSSEPVAKAPEPAPAPEPTPEPEPAPEPAADQTITIKGVEISNANAVLAFANSASEDDLKAAGVKGSGLKALLGARPIASAEDLGSISGFGKKSIESLANGAK